MGIFSTTVDEIATANGAKVFTGLLGLKMADTEGHVGRLRRIIIAGAAAAPQDEQVTVRGRITNNTADGTSTAVNVNTIHKHDPLGVASLMAAIGKTYTVEATAKTTELIGIGGLNARGVLIRDFTQDKHPPKWGRKQTLIIEGAPGQAVAVSLSVTVEWEE